MRIAFYYRNNGIKDVDCRNLEYGNPGIGGTHFVMLQVASLLTKIKIHDVYLFAESVENLPLLLNVVKVPTEESLADCIRNYNIEILVANRTTPQSFNEKTISILKTTDVSVILWAHVYMPTSFLSILAKENIIKKVVAVSKHQLYTYCDHPVFEKSTYVYNICNFINPEVLVDYRNRKNNVVYVGAINYIKGVHLLLQAWPKIRKRVPDANLYIIGSGHLYSKKDVLGKFGITEKYYEKECLKKIVCSNKIDESVHFLGVLGEKKWRYLSQAKVGVVNTHYWETFGFTAIEMQLAGTPIVSFKSPGLIDTVCSKRSILYTHENNLADSIINVLTNNNDYNPAKDIEMLNSKFKTEVIIKKWNDIFESVKSCEYNDLNMSDNEFKFVKYQVVNKKLKRSLPFLPSLLVMHEFYLSIKHLFFVLKQPSKVMCRIINSMSAKN